MADRHDVQLRTQLLEKIFPSVDTVDNLDSDNPNRPLSARQGKVLKELIETSGGGGSGLSMEVVDSLPAVGTKGILYLVPKTSYLKEENTYDEYVWIESSSKYEMLGSFSTDLNIEEYVNKFNSVLGEVQEINVATLGNSEINNYTTTGTYRIYGERINNADGLPILNAANGHTVEGVLKVYNSSISGSGKDTDKVVTQMLNMSNRHGGDGHIWIRTGQGSSEDNLTWSTWEKLQGIFEKNIITNISEIDNFTTNGIYSCMYVGPAAEISRQALDVGDTLLIIVVNGYMASSVKTVPHLTQTIVKNGVGSGQNKIITRSAIWQNNSWNFDSDYPSVVLGSFCGKNANIGGIADPNNIINIGTYSTEQLHIRGNTFIGNNINYSNIDDDSTIIKHKVRLGESVFIGTRELDNFNKIDSVAIARGVAIGQYVAIGTTSPEPDWVCIGNGVRLQNNEDIFWINSYNHDCDLNVYPNTHVGFKGGKNTNITFNNNCNIDIGIPKISISTLPDEYSIKTTTAEVLIKDGLSIGKYVKILHKVSIGTVTGDVYIGDGVSIGNNVKITNIYNDANPQIKFGTSSLVTFNGGEIIIGSNSQAVYIGAETSIGDNVTIVNNYSPSQAVIAFDNNSVTFQIAGKTAILELS